MLGPYSWAGEETEAQRGKALAVGHTPVRNVNLDLRLRSTEPPPPTPPLRPEVSRVWIRGQHALSQGLGELGADESCFFVFCFLFSHELMCDPHNHCIYRICLHMGHYSVLPETHVKS